MLAAKIWPQWIIPEDIGMMGWIGAILVVTGSMATSLLGPGRDPAVKPGIVDGGQNPPHE